MEKKIKIPMLLALVLMASVCSASDTPDVGKFFAYPKTKITLTVGDAIGHSISSENFGRQTKPTVGEWTFRNGLGNVVEEKEFGEITWVFLKKSEYGDVYIFSMKSESGETKVIPVLFQGEPILKKFKNTEFFMQLAN